MADETRVEGIDAATKKLQAIPRALRVRALRNALAAGARAVRDTARSATPVLSAPAPYRTPGTVRNAIRVRTSKAARREGDVGVFVNVKPLPGNKYQRTGTTIVRGKKRSTFRLVTRSQRGAQNPLDPFYWRFIQFGTKRMQASPFLSRGAARLPEALRIFQQRMGDWFAKLNSSGKVQP
nr:HK97-gp10 family putative phage morphogenesis protein [uncultured Albidiferax sp.]